MRSNIRHAALRTLDVDALDGHEGGRIVVIGVGHRDRADDGIGPAVVDALSHRTAAVTTVVREGDLAVLPMLWEETDDVVIVDACFAGDEPVGRLQQINPADLMSSAGLSTHGISVVEAIELASRLSRLPARLRVMGITAHDFSHRPMSLELCARIEELADELLCALDVDGEVPPTTP